MSHKYLLPTAASGDCTVSQSVTGIVKFQVLALLNVYGKKTTLKQQGRDCYNKGVLLSPGLIFLKYEALKPHTVFVFWWPGLISSTRQHVIA